METVKMHGPSISDPSRVVNRDVPEGDVRAYQAVGYKFGSIEEPALSDSFVDLAKMSKAQLIERAEGLGLLEVSAAMTKAEIVALIEGN